MNIISTTVGLSLIGAASPMIMNMAITPVVAQKRAQNFGEAETSAVTFAAQNEGKTSVADAPPGCELADLNDGAYTVTCSVGQGKYAQTVVRGFRLDVGQGGMIGFVGNGNGTGSAGRGGGASARVFANPVPGKISYVHQCPPGDEWGLNWWNATHGPALGSCTPQVAWNSSKYHASDPDAWLYDINNFNGYGHHKDY